MLGLLGGESTGTGLEDPEWGGCRLVFVEGECIPLSYIPPSTTPPAIPTPPKTAFIRSDLSSGTSEVDTSSKEDWGSIRKVKLSGGVFEIGSIFSLDFTAIEREGDGGLHAQRFNNIKNIRTIFLNFTKRPLAIDFF
jgi:hypothetical protein